MKLKHLFLKITIVAALSVKIFRTFIAKTILYDISNIEIQDLYD